MLLKVKKKVQGRNRHRIKRTRFTTTSGNSQQSFKQRFQVFNQARSGTNRVTKLKLSERRSTRPNQPSRWLEVLNPMKIGCLTFLPSLFCWKRRMMMSQPTSNRSRGRSERFKKKIYSVVQQSSGR